jgi:cytochrome c biogenesis protein CcmG, thiol:disulfide interchange protein DsbE
MLPMGWGSGQAMEARVESAGSDAPLSRARLLRLLGMLASIALVIALGALLVARIVSATQVVKQAPKYTTPTMVGASAPNVTLAIWSGGAIGKTLALSSLHGHPTVMNVWEADCVPCQAEAPLLESAYGQYGPKGVAFVGVALETSQADGLAFLQQHHLTYLAGLAPTNQTVVDYRIIGVPDTYFISAQGKVVYAVIGQLDKAKLDAGLAKLTA